MVESWEGSDDVVVAVAPALRNKWKNGIGGLESVYYPLVTGACDHPEGPVVAIRQMTKGDMSIASVHWFATHGYASQLSKKTHEGIFVGTEAEAFDQAVLRGEELIAAKAPEDILKGRAEKIAVKQKAGAKGGAAKAAKKAAASLTLVTNNDARTYEEKKADDIKNLRFLLEGNKEGQ